MRFPKYKVHSLVGLFKIRILRSEYLDVPNAPLISWGRCAAYNYNRVLRIGNLPLDRSEITPWRQHILHEIAYLNNRIKTYSNRWQKAYERCYLALRKLPNGRGMGTYPLWQITAFNEASRLNINYGRNISASKFKYVPHSWEASHEWNAWLLRQKPLQINPPLSSWDLTFASIKRNTFRARRFEWDECAKRAEESLTFNFSLRKPKFGQPEYAIGWH